jgi:hypothetical protein
MRSSIENLMDCLNPFLAAIIFSPRRPEYYLADEPRRSLPPAEPVVKITLSSAAQRVMKNNVEGA